MAMMPLKAAEAEARIELQIRTVLCDVLRTTAVNIKRSAVSGSLSLGNIALALLLVLHEKPLHTLLTRDSNTLF